MKKQDIGLSYEIYTVDLKEPNFLKAFFYFVAFVGVIFLVVNLTGIIAGLTTLYS